MKNTFVKPHINFPMFPLIYAYIESAYNKVTDFESFTKFIHDCLNEAETTNNEVKKTALNSVAKALYGKEIGCSYESKSIELIVNCL
jgi:hypothetical protein